LWAACETAADYSTEADADFVVVFHPDHVNGFFYKLLPPFCVGIEASSVGDYGTAAGKLEVPEDRAMACAEYVLGDGVDVAISYRMDVDHGGAQPVELLSAKSPLTQMIPIFINCALSPRPTLPRVRALGAAVGRWAAKCPQRILIIGSGGLSHDPPVASLATATPEVRQRLIEGGALAHSQRMVRQNNVMGEGTKYAAGQSKLLPLDPDWDQILLKGFSSGDLSVLDAATDEEITKTGGRGGHEVRCWVAALAALGESYKSDVVFYEPIAEWLTGMAVMTATPA
jgi:2,3-dihydroxyphenylpropionate 1,2-dioxygenase